MRENHQVDASTAVSLVCEVISLIAVPGGLGCLVASAVSAANEKRWVEAEAVVMMADGRPVAGWFDDHGRLHEARLGRDAPEQGEDVAIWVGRADSSRHRFTSPGAHTRTLRTLGFALLIPGIAAVVIGFVATLTS